MRPSRIVAACLGLALLILAVQAGGVIKTLGARVAAHVKVADPPAAIVQLPGIITLDMPSGTLTCRLSAGSYTCTPMAFPRSPR